MKRKPELIFLLAIIAAFGVALFSARHWSIQASLFPFMIGGIGLSLALVQLVSFLTGDKAEGKDAGKGKEATLTILFTLGWILVFFLSPALLGFQWGLPIIIFLYLKIMGKEKLFLSLILSMIAWLILYGFATFLNIPFHEGLL